MTTNKAEQDYKASHPVQQSLHTGLWGFRRVGDCIDLNQCVYETKHEAELARSEAARAETAQD